jgi:hypothetical protein
MIRQLVYISTTREPLDDATLAAILTRARQRNAEYGVTGVLLYSDQSVMQVLEGVETAVDIIYRIVCNNPLHSGVTVVQDRMLPQRDFGSWAMAYQPIHKSALEQLTGAKVLAPEVLAGIAADLTQPEAKSFVRHFGTRGSLR